MDGTEKIEDRYEAVSELYKTQNRLMGKSRSPDYSIWTTKMRIWHDIKLHKVTLELARAQQEYAKLLNDFVENNSDDIDLEAPSLVLN